MSRLPREKPRKKAEAHDRGRFVFEIERRRRMYKRREEESAAAGKWPRIVRPLAVAAIRLDGSAVRSADCEKLPFDFET